MSRRKLKTSKPALREKKREIESGGESKVIELFKFSFSPKIRKMAEYVKK